MPVEINPNGSMSITGPDGIALFRLVTCYHALKLQANTGMKMSRISATKCAQQMGFKGRTAKSLLKDMLQKHPELKNSDPNPNRY